MPSFRELPEHELEALSDEELVAYIRGAREADQANAERTALAILVFGHWENVKRRVWLKVPPDDVEDVAAEVLHAALRSVFAGESVGQFRSWLNTVVQRRIADFHRAREGKEERPLPEEHEAEEDSRRDTIPAPDDTSAVEMRSVVDQALAELTGAHRFVVERRLEGYSAREAAELANNDLAKRLERPMTADNAHQIFSRFRKRIDDLLGDDPEAPKDAGNRHQDDE